MKLYCCAEGSCSGSREWTTPAVMSTSAATCWVLGRCQGEGGCHKSNWAIFTAQITLRFKAQKDILVSLLIAKEISKLKLLSRERSQCLCYELTMILRFGKMHLRPECTLS